MENVCCESPSKIKNSVLTMAMLEPGSKGHIKDFIMNCEDNGSCTFVRRLKEIGLYSGAYFEVLKNNGNGEISVSCQGSTLALGRGMADKINVEISDGSVISGSFIGRFCRSFGIKCRP
ncbi:MAG: hypothetical protein C0603_07830 [Denitrovibrio sp.]|nr:MAG: hypothetical protein C0603_07830 [Denitrovibrio sp.]